MKTRNMTALLLRNSINRSPLPRRSPATVGRRWACRAVVPRRRDKGGSLLTVLLLACVCFAFSPAPKAFGVSPAPDGGYPNQNTAEGADALFSLSTGFANTATGFQALFSNTTGNYDTANGSQALYKNTVGNFNAATGFRALYSNTTGQNNTANGHEALAGNSTGFNNTADGFKALYSNSTGNGNTANGYQALYSNARGNGNTANGYQALYKNNNAFDNTASGSQALYNNTSGGGNTATGSQSLYGNTTGYNNTAIGSHALYSDTTGYYNTAVGFHALYSNTDGIFNLAIGNYALESNTGGSGNEAYGIDALDNNTTGGQNTAIGDSALQSNSVGNRNIAVGINAGNLLTTGDDNIDIGNAVSGNAGESSTIRIGQPFGTFAQNRTFIAGIRGVTTGNADAIPVVIDSAGQLGTMSSSKRFKKEIKPMEQTSEAILALKPVTFQYKSDPSGTAQFGLIAEEVAKVDPELVVRDAEGEIYSVRYEAVNAMLLNEFLKEHRTVQELKSIVAKQEAIIAQQQKGMEAVIAHLKEQDLKIQNVNDQLELSSPRRAAQLAGND